MHYEKRRYEPGFTLVELVIGLTILAIVSLSLTGLFTALINSAAVAKQKAVATTLATNQMEYLKSLPYDNLAVTGGSIYATTTIPPTTNQTVNGVMYTIKTAINYVDDAYDGCANYGSLSKTQEECRNYPPPSNAPVDSSPWDYKVADVKVYNPGGSQLAQDDTEISARVAETSSTTGSLFVTVIDANGDPVSGASVSVSNTKLTPAVNLSDNTDQNGIALFYDLPADTTAYDYIITASASGYSTVTTIPPSGSLQPNYSNQKIFAQQSTSLALTIKLQGPDSLLVETTDVNGNPLGNVKVYVKGGYKKYTASSDTSYCYDDMILNGTTTACSTSATVSDNRLVTDPTTGLASLSNLVPGAYTFCGDLGATSCQIGGTTYYLAAAIPYSGNNPFNPINVPTYDPSSPPTATFTYNSRNYYQKVRLMLTSSQTFPRVSSVTPYDVGLGSGTISNFAFQISGSNLPCSASPGSCSTQVKLAQGTNNYTASCTGTSGGTLVNCTVNLSTASAGNITLSITANGQTLNLPDLPLMGGISVTP